MSTRLPAICWYRLKTSDGTLNPATCPMCRGPLAYGQATAVRTWVLSTMSSSVMIAGSPRRPVNPPSRLRPYRAGRVDAAPDAQHPGVVGSETGIADRHRLPGLRHLARL